MLGLSLVGFVVQGAHAQTKPQQQSLDRNLEIAGFVMREANTPQRMARLKTIPSHRFVSRTRDGQRYYLYADPTDCRCVFVGGQKAFDTFKAMTAPDTPPPGYRVPVDVAPPSGVNPMRDIVNDMRDDLDSMDPDDIFHPGF